MISQALHRVTTDDRFIVQNGTYSLVIANVTLDDQGEYMCNILPANITMKAKLVVLPPLEARIYHGGRDSTDRSITYAENAEFEVECKASGRVSDRIAYKWSANGDQLKSSEHLKIDGGKLLFKKASYDDVRVYSCLADDGVDAAQATISINIRCKSCQASNWPSVCILYF